MRQSSVNFLALACLLYLLGWSNAAAAGQKNQPREPRDNRVTISRPPAPPAATIQWDVMLEAGEFRSTEMAAKDEVWNKACNQVANFVNQFRPDLNWAPTKKFLKEKFKCGEPTVEPAQNTSEIDPAKGTLYTARLRLELTPMAREEMLRIVRLEEARDRQWTLCKLMAVVLMFLVVVAGSLRISERAKAGQ
jgi:hypothetical protein